MKDSDIFSQRELRLLYSKKPELKPLKIPSINEAKTIKVPSINEAVLLTQPSIDQIIVEFLKQYEVNIKPQNVGDWNGWDTIATLDAFMNRGSGGSTIANTLFYASRSNQVSQSAQDWQTWKRWAIDHKNFDKYKDDVIQGIISHNENAIKDVEESIRKAELNNKNAIKEVEQSIRKAELHNENLVRKLQKQKPEFKEYISQLVESENLRIKKLRLKRNKIFIFILLPIFLMGSISIYFLQLEKINKERERKEKIQNLQERIQERRIDRLKKIEERKKQSNDISAKNLSRKKEFLDLKTISKTYKNGDKYQGQWLNNEEHGQGTYTWANGDKYIGKFVEGKRTGRGTYFLADGSKYVGEFRDDKAHGQGTFTWVNGDIYVGEFRDDKRHGKGTYTWANGTSWTGQWRNGSRISY